MPVITVAMAGYVFAVAALDVGGFLPLPGSGPIALAEILSAHLSLAALVVVPFALLPGTKSLRLALMVLAIVAVARFGGEWWSTSAQATGPTVDVMTWN